MSNPGVAPLYSVACPTCYAAPNQSCVGVKSGNRCRPHATRVASVHELLDIGVRQGRSSQQVFLENLIEGIDAKPPRLIDDGTTLWMPRALVVEALQRARSFIKPTEMSK